MAGQLTHRQLAEFKEAFSQFDIDGNGTVAMAELGALMRSIGLNPAEPLLRNLIGDATCYSHETGAVEFPEFLSLIARMADTIDVGDGSSESSGPPPLVSSSSDEEERSELSDSSTSSAEERHRFAFLIATAAPQAPGNGHPVG